MKRIALAVVLSLVAFSPALAQQASTDNGQTPKKHHHKKQKTATPTTQPAQ
jgi:hypothetical protein